MLVWEEDMVRALRKERESLREENARLTQRVEELEREGDEAEQEYTEQRCRAEAAEAKVEEQGQAWLNLWNQHQELKAKLANVVETLEYLRKANDPHDCPRNWCECCFIESALAAAKGE